MPSRHHPPSQQGQLPWIWLFATFVVVVIAAIALIVLTGDPSDESTEILADQSTTTPEGLTATITLDPGSDSNPETDSGTDLAPWLGSLRWTEVAEQGDGVNRSASHQLDLTTMSDDGMSLLGRLRQDGIDPANDLAVKASIIDGTLTVLAAPTSGDTSSYVDREILVRFTGSPGAPMTTLAGLRTLLSWPGEPGFYLGRGDGGTSAQAVTTTTSTATTEPAKPTSTTQEPTTTEPVPGIERWAGTYTWSEFVGGGASSDQTLIHQLELTVDPADPSHLNGHLIQNGFQLITDVVVSGEPSGPDLIVVVITDNSPELQYPQGAVLVHFGGDPANPITTLAELIILQEGITASGSYFSR